jgi:hypothetical protein
LKTNYPITNFKTFFKMKYLSLLFTLLFSVISFSQISEFDTILNSQINQYIADSTEIGKVTSPLFLMDGVPISTYEIQNSAYKNLKWEDIERINVYNPHEEAYVTIWGNEAENGIVLINTTFVKENESKDANNSAILFIWNNQVIEQDKLEQIKQEDIESVMVLKNERLYKIKDIYYDGIVILNSK